MRKFFLNIPVAFTWITSIALSAPHTNSNFLAEAASLLAALAPIASKAASASSFPDTTYAYFLVMQPLSLLLLTISWFPAVQRLDYRQVTHRYANFNVLGRLAAWAMLSLMAALALLLILYAGKQEPPGMHIHSSRVALAAFGPLVAGGLSVLIAAFCYAVARNYINFHRKVDYHA